MGKPCDEVLWILFCPPNSLKLIELITMVEARRGERSTYEIRRGTHFCGAQASREDIAWEAYAYESG
jgi:hypothetical protein